MFHNFSKKIVAAGMWVTELAMEPGGGSISSGSPRLPRGSPTGRGEGSHGQSLAWAGAGGAHKEPERHTRPIGAPAIGSRSGMKTSEGGELLLLSHYLLPETKCMSQVRIGPVDAP